jgi:MFS family permease
MVPVAAMAGRLTDVWGRKTILLIGFIALPIRGVLFTLSDQPLFVISVQILDGVGAALFGVLSVLVVADLTKGTGRFNITQGAIATAAGVGASLGMLLAGLIAQYAGYQAAFLSLAAVATAALLVFWTLMPETKQFATAGREVDDFKPGVPSIASAQAGMQLTTPSLKQAADREHVLESRLESERDDKFGRVERQAAQFNFIKDSQVLARNKA